MGDAAREFAVVGHQERAARVVVEPAHWRDARRNVAHEISDGAPALGIAQGRDHGARLVEHHIHERLGHQPAPVHFDAGRARVRFGAELGDLAAIHAHASRADQRFGVAP